MTFDQGHQVIVLLFAILFFVVLNASTNIFRGGR